MEHSTVTYRPYGIILKGQLELGLEIVVHAGQILEVRPHTGIPEPYVLSPAFVNAHSHLEYRGLQGLVHEEDYWSWIRELTKRKASQSPEQVLEDSLLAAGENVATGVGLIAEHSDRPAAGLALSEYRLEGVIFQEVITFFERDDRKQKLLKVVENASANRKRFNGPVFLSPHAYYTVDPDTLKEIGESGDPFSIHVAETALESEFTRDGKGLIADFYRSNNVPFEPTGKSIVFSLDQLGLVREGAQFVHCCDVSNDEISLMAIRKVSVAHCPRSNNRLNCPSAPIREMLDAGISVGLGLDSPASSGPIDMFAEMRAALDTSRFRGKPISAEEVWMMATSMGAASLREATGPRESWEIEPGSRVPLIRIDVNDALSTEDLISNPLSVEFTSHL